MAVSSPIDFTQQLQELMQPLGFRSYRQLSENAGVSEKQLRRLRRGQIAQMQVKTLVKLAQVLQVSVSDLLVIFSPDSTASPSSISGENMASLEAMRHEYQRLQQQLHEQREKLIQEFQQSSLQALESFLVFWPTAAYKARENPQLPAVKVLRLVQPVEQMLQDWGVEAIAEVGSEIHYDPQLHQLLEGTAQAGESVRVRNTGYRHQGKLLYRAKVSPIGNTSHA
jgi:DNA-binding Xre family transcriptional regulator/molecular chaperone GrpE (heat shock protein)